MPSAFALRGMGTRSWGVEDSRGFFTFRIFTQIKFMTTTSLKKQIHESVDSIHDTDLLEAVYTILNKAGTKKSLKPMSLDEFYARNAQSQKEIKEGKLFTQEEVKKKFRTRK